MKIFSSGVASRCIAVVAAPACTALSVGLLFAPRGAVGNELGGSLAAVTNYVYRGVSQTRGDPAVQADVHYTHASGWAAGAWGSTVKLGRDSDRDLEFDLYAARDWSLGKNWDLRTSYTHYLYAGDAEAGRFNYDEAAVSLSYQSQAAVTVGWSPNVMRYDRWAGYRRARALSYEISASQPISSSFSAVAGVGYYDLSAVLDTGYWYWNLGCTYLVGRVQLALLYIDADAQAGRLASYGTAENRVAGSAVWKF